MAATEGPEYVLRYVSASFCEVVGKESDTLIGLPMAVVIPGSVIGAVKLMLDRVYLATDGEQSGKMDLTDPDSRSGIRAISAWTIPWSEDLADGLIVEISGSVESTKAELRQDVVNFDIRELNERLLIKSVEQHELAATAVSAERRMRELVQGVNAILCEVDTKTGRFTFVSDKARSFLGYSIDRWNEPGFWKLLIHPEYYESAMWGFEVATREGRDHQHEFLVTAADGSAIWLRNNAHVVRNEFGAVTKLRTIIVDVTEQALEREILAKAFDRERAIAEALQYFVLLEKSEDVFPGLAVATIYEAALEEALVGGDFFDAVKLPSGQVMLVIGDVTGKGLVAASRTVEVKYALRAFAQTCFTPAEAALRLNDYVCQRHLVAGQTDTQYIALLIAIVEPSTGLIQFISAGAEPPFIVRASGAVDKIATSGLMIGVECGTIYDQKERHLEPGDLVVLTTDGITEARQGLDFFGTDRIAQIVADSDPAISLHETGTAIVSAARAHGGGHFRDDVCVLLMKLT